MTNDLNKDQSASKRKEGIQPVIEVEDYRIERQRREYSWSYFHPDFIYDSYFAGWDSPGILFGVIFALTHLDGCVGSGWMWESDWQNHPAVDIFVGSLAGLFVSVGVAWVVHLIWNAPRLWELVIGKLKMICKNWTVFFRFMPNKMQSILLVGIITGLVGALAFFIPAAGEFIICLAYIIAGVFVVWHYTDKNKFTLTSGQGIGLGVSACIVASLTQSALHAGLQALATKPNMQEEMRQGIEEGGGSGEFVTSLVFLIGVRCVFAMIPGIFGGLIGSKAFKRGKSRLPLE